ncbi:MAG: hypothetical protein N3B15_00745 [Planctomycetota bacterium]|nr:hypothetical protein [Planctomycetota bacterium]
MGRSLLPLLLVAVIVAVGLAAIWPRVERGQGGPAVYPGILRLPAKDPIRTAAAPLSGSTVAEVQGAGRDDGQWRVVLLLGEDREPLTRAVMLALGEALFQAGVVAVLDPLLPASEPAPPLALPADRVVRIATLAARGTEDRRAAWSASVRLALSEPRLPDDHPLAAQQPAPLASPLLVRVQHEGGPAAGSDPPWPERWAAAGRAIAAAFLAATTPPGGPRVPELHPGVAWETPLPLPPLTPEVRWHGAFQHALIRGWVGRIAGRRVLTREGREESADAPFIRLLARGAWQALPAEGAWRLWERLHDGQRQWCALRDDGDGWTVTVWHLHPDPQRRLEQWLAEAQAGDRAASARLERLRSVPGLPEDLRARLAAIAP